MSVCVCAHVANAAAVYLQEDEGLDGTRGQKRDDGQTLRQLLQVRDVAGQEVALWRRRKREMRKDVVFSPVFTARFPLPGCLKTEALLLWIAVSFFGQEVQTR